MKRCPKCRRDLPASEFGVDRSTPDGRCYWCRSCKRESKRRYRGANREKVRERSLRWYYANREKSREYNRRWREAHPAYASWWAMQERCTCPSSDSYTWYGARGITVCERWSEPNGQGFANFLADMGERPEGKKLDRIDPDGHYEPSNYRWATPKQQRANQRKAAS